MERKREVKDAKVMDRVLTWSCNGISSSNQNIEVPGSVRSVECLRISYANDNSENGFSQLKCSTLFGPEVFATFADTRSPTDSWFLREFAPETRITGSHTFTWDLARAGTIYVHLRFRYE